MRYEFDQLKRTLAESRAEKNVHLVLHGALLCRLFPCVDRRLRMDRHVVRLKLHRKNPSTTTTTTIQQNDDPAASSRSRTSPLGWVSLPSKGPLSQRLESLAVARARS